MGTYKQSIFSSENGYVIGLMRVKDTDMESMKDYINKTITFTGYFHELTEQDNYYFFGQETVHPKYGFQFVVERYERVKPEDKDGIVEFLSSDLFKGVGEKLAQSDWTYVEKAGHKRLAGYCSKIGVTSDGKTPQTVTKEVFEPAKNPLICASSLEEAKQSYGLFVQGQSRKASTQMVFMFIGAWLVILLALFGLMKWTNSKAAPESASTAGKSKSKARR